MRPTLRATGIIAIWVAVLAVLGWYVQKDLVIGTDLRLFLPSPTTAEQRLLLDEIGEGPASRVLVVTSLLHHPLGRHNRHVCHHHRHP